MLLLILSRCSILLREYLAISLFVVTISFCVSIYQILWDSSDSLTLAVHTTFISINNLISILRFHLSQRHLACRIDIHTQSGLSFICAQMYAILISLLIIRALNLIYCVTRELYEGLATAGIPSESCTKLWRNHVLRSNSLVNMGHDVSESRLLPILWSSTIILYPVRIFSTTAGLEKVWPLRLLLNLVIIFIFNFLHVP